MCMPRVSSVSPRSGFEQRRSAIGMTAISAAVAIAIAVAPAHAQSPATAPVNLAPNSQWEIWSAVGFGIRQNPQGTGAEAPIASSGYTGGRTATFTVASTGNLSIGDLVSVSGSGVDSSLTLMPMRTIALVKNVSITVRVPLGASPANATSTTSSIVPIGVGAYWYNLNSTGDGPDGWSRYPTSASNGPILWRDFARGNYSVNAPSAVRPYALLGARLQKSGGSVFYTDQTLNVSRYAGQTISFGMYVMQKIKGGTNTYRLFFNDSVNGPTYCSSSTAAAGSWSWAECAYTVAAGASFLHAGVDMNGAAGDVYYFCDPVLTIGSSIGGVHNYIKPQNEILIPKVHITPLGPWNGSTNSGNITFPATTTVQGNAGAWYGFYHDPFAETGGQVAPTVAYIWGQLEGINAGSVQTGTGQVRSMMWYDRSAATPPGHSGSFLPEYVANVKSFASMGMPLNQADQTLDIRGTGIFQSGVAGDAWTNVALEYDMFLLN